MQEKEVAPGHWLIEGHDVKAGFPKNWVIYDHDKQIANVGSLDEARSWIQDRRARFSSRMEF